METLRALARALRGRCPHCGRGRMFRGLYALHERCDVCGTRFERGEGAWIGGVAIGCGFGAFFGLALALIELRWHPIAHAGLDPAWTIAIAALPFTVLAYRPAKALWFGLLYRYGFMDTPAAPGGGADGPAAG